VDLHRVNQLIGTDPALTTSLLRLANSDLFKLGGKINSVSEALALLNLSLVRSMVQGAAQSASLKAVPGINMQRFWDYSLNVARVSRSLAGVVRQNQQAAFTCGLIHAFGELAMHVAMPQETAQLSEKFEPLDLRRASAERNAFGFCYATVSAGFARQWRFPQAMVDALEHQYAPFENNVYEPMAGVIHLAAWRARGKEAKLNERALAVTFPGSVGLVLGLDIDMVLQQDPFDWAAHT
jgi:HD-like signal output (HDOD) protein